MPVEPPAELVERLRAELPESPAARIRRIEAELDLDRAVVLVTGGLDALWQATVAAGADPVAAANVIANRLAGVDGGAVDPAELAKLVEARDRIPRSRARRGARQGRGARLLGGAVPRAGGSLGHRRARADRRADPRRQSRPGRRLSRRQGGTARLLRRPGDEGDRRQGERARGQRARAREAHRRRVKPLRGLAVAGAAALGALFAVGCVLAALFEAQGFGGDRDSDPRRLSAAARRGARPVRGGAVLALASVAARQCAPRRAGLCGSCGRRVRDPRHRFR